MELLCVTAVNNLEPVTGAACLPFRLRGLVSLQSGATHPMRKHLVAGLDILSNRSDIAKIKQALGIHAPDQRERENVGHEPKLQPLLRPGKRPRLNGNNPVKGAIVGRIGNEAH